MCLMNGGTLILRGSDWRDTLSEVCNFHTTQLHALTSFKGRHSHLHTFDSRTIPAKFVPKHQMCSNRWRVLPTTVHSFSNTFGRATDFTRLADEWAENAIFYNICGPTEISILNTAHRHEPGMPLSVGKPLPNTTCYILDDNEQPVPFGAKGFMWVGGAGVSKGYINLPELTSTRYKVDKFKNDG